MNESVTRGLGISATFHVALVLALVAAAALWVRKPAPTLEPLVLTLTSDGSMTPRVETILPPATKPLFNAPRLPAPSPQPQSSPATPAIARPEAPAPKPKPQIVPTAPQRLTMEQFQRLHGNASAKTPAPLSPISTPRIEVPVFAPIAVSTPSYAVQATDAEAQLFTAALLGILQGAYTSIGAEEKGLSCPVEFTLQSDGRVHTCKLQRSSGNRLFDEAVLTALKRVKVNAPPRAFVGTAIRTTFQVQPPR